MKLQVLLGISALLFLCGAQADENIRIRSCVATGGFDSVTVIPSQIVLNWHTDSAVLNFTSNPWQEAVSFNFVYSEPNLSIAVSDDQKEMAVLNWEDGQNATLKVGDRLNPLPKLGKYIDYKFHCDL